MEATARTFLALYWRAGDRTYGKLADELASVATPEMLGPWRDPAHSGAPAGVGSPVDLVSVTITAASPVDGVVAGKGVNTVNGNIIWRTLGLVRGDDGVWRVGSFR